ncbi:MAG: DUF4136 domain-containing protein [Polyangiaceae bacterium]|jgi:hypothetical protein
MKTIAFALVCSMASGCYAASASSGPQIETAASPSTPLAAYRTFSFGFTENSPTTFHTSARSLEVDRRIRELIGADLREKGYLEDDTKPNFVVRFGAGTQQQTAADVELKLTSKEDSIDLGKIEIDVFDASTKVAVWQGSAVSHIDLTKDIDNTVLQRAVQGILNTFPSHSPAVSQPAAKTVSAGGAQ